MNNKIILSDLSIEQAQELKDQLDEFLTPKKDPRDILFAGCPIMVRRNVNDLWGARYFARKRSTEGRVVAYSNRSTPWSDGGLLNYTKWAEWRLPTIEESPRLTKLAHDPESGMPEGVGHLDVIVWDKDDGLIPKVEKGSGWDWPYE